MGHNFYPHYCFLSLSINVYLAVCKVQLGFLHLLTLCFTGELTDSMACNSKQEEDNVITYFIATKLQN